MSIKPFSDTPTERVIALVNKFGNNKAASELGVSAAKLCRWLKAQGYVRRSQYVRISNPTTAAIMKHAEEVHRSN